MWFQIRTITGPKCHFDWWICATFCALEHMGLHCLISKNGFLSQKIRSLPNITGAYSKHVSHLISSFGLPSFPSSVVFVCRSHTYKSLMSCCSRSNFSASSSKLKASTSSWRSFSSDRRILKFLELVIIIVCFPCFTMNDQVDSCLKWLIPWACSECSERQTLRISAQGSDWKMIQKIKGVKGYFSWEVYCIYLVRSNTKARFLQKTLWQKHRKTFDDNIFFYSAAELRVSDPAPLSFPSQPLMHLRVFVTRRGWDPASPHSWEKRRKGGCFKYKMQMENTVIIRSSRIILAYNLLHRFWVEMSLPTWQGTSMCRIRISRCLTRAASRGNVEAKTKVDLAVNWNTC